MNQQNLSSFIWSVADLLRGDYKQSEYGKVILPFTVLRRLDCVLDGTKQAVLKEQEKPNLNIERIGALLTVKPKPNEPSTFSKNAAPPSSPQPSPARSTFENVHVDI
jgi:type I restriction-modification system DNA methylase subunit